MNPSHSLLSRSAGPTVNPSLPTGTVASPCHTWPQRPSLKGFSQCLPLASGPLQVTRWPPGFLSHLLAFPQKNSSFRPWFLHHILPAASPETPQVTDSPLALYPHTSVTYLCVCLLSFSLDHRLRLSWPLHKSDRAATKCVIVNLCLLSAYCIPLLLARV